MSRYFSLNLADSACQRNRLVKTKAFSGPHVNLIDDLGHVFITQIINIFSLLDVLPDQTASVFVEASLPRVIGVSKEPLRSQFVGDLFMVCELSATIPSE